MVDVLICEIEGCEDVGISYYVSGGPSPTVSTGYFSIQMLAHSDIARGAWHTLCGHHALRELGVAFGGMR